MWEGVLVDQRVAGREQVIDGDEVDADLVVVDGRRVAGLRRGEHDHRLGAAAPYPPPITSTASRVAPSLVHRSSLGLLDSGRPPRLEGRELRAMRVGSPAPLLWSWCSGRSSPLLFETSGAGDRGQLGPVGHTELAEDVGEVRLDGAS